MKTVRQLIEAEERALRTRSTWETVWADCYDFAMPGHNGFTNISPGQRADDQIFDETAVVGIQEFASRMVQGITPNNARWVRLEPAPPTASALSADDLKSMQGELDEVTNYVFEVINNSNFSQEIHEAMLDVGIGTGNMVVEEGDALHPIKFNTVPLSQVALERGPFDSVGAQYRRRSVRVDAIELVWPTAVLNKELMTLKDKEPWKEIWLTEVCYRDWSEMDEVHYYCVFHKGSEHKIYSETYTGIGSNPWITFRWAKTASEIYGRGPLFNALAAIKTCNLTVQLILENAELSVSGVWQGDDDGVLNPANIRMLPGTVIPRSAGSRGLEALKFPGNFDVAQLVLNDMRHNINKALYNETLGRREGTPISATEVAERMGELSRQLGSTYGRLQAELVFPLIKRVIYILKKQGRIELPQIDGREVQIRAVSPLMRSQRNEDIAQHINYVRTIGELFGPAVVQTIVDPIKLGTKLAPMYEIDPDILIDEETREQLTQQTGEVMAQAEGGGADMMATMRELMP